MKEIAEEYADKVQPPFSILLKGDIGAGKTTFSQFFIKKLLIDKSKSVTSPTFNIIQIYETIKGPVWHIDLYRLKKEEELFELGVLEAMCDSICLIEWPYMLEKYIERYNFTELDLS